MDRTRAITVGSIGTVVAAAALALAATTGLVTLPESTPTSAGDPPVTVTTSPTPPASRGAHRHRPDPGTAGATGR